MEFVGMLIGIALLLFAGLTMLVIGLGWVVPTGMGINRLRRGEGGSGLIVAGVLWGAIAVFVGVTVFRAGGAYFARFMPTPFDPAAYEGETGEVHLTWDGPCELTVFCTTDDRRWLLSGEEGRVVGPVGDYRISSWTLNATDDNGRTWSARGHSWGQQGPSRVRITADDPVRLEVGPPFTAHLHIDTRGTDRVEISLSIVGSEGASYAIAPQGRPRAPSFEVLDASGRVIWSDDFEFG